MISTVKLTRKTSCIVLLVILGLALFLITALAANAQTRFGLVDKTYCKVFDNRFGITCIGYGENIQTFFWNDYTQAKTLPRIGREIEVYYYRGTQHLYDWFLYRKVENFYLSRRIKICSSKHYAKY